MPGLKVSDIGVIDFAQPMFWLLVLFIVPALAVWVGPTRNKVRAFVNLYVILMMIGAWGVAGALALATTTWLMARFVSRAGSGAGALWLASVPLIALFVLHKLDAIRCIGVTPCWPAGAQAILAGLGFSYLFLRAIDLLRAVNEKRHPVPSPTDLVNYLVPFHMLAAGPIEAYDDFVEQPFVARKLNARDTLDSIERIVSGLFKKYVLAQLIQSVFLTGFRADGIYLLAEIQLHYVWVYLDFSAYSDIAVGLGTLMGIHTPENFDRPFAARNIVAFWERWHISLSQWIRRNLFIPVQLNLMRHFRGTHPMLMATVAFGVAFLLCGLWHDLSLRFLLWGAYHAAGLSICNLYRHILEKRLGRKGVKVYMQNRLIHWAATAVTFEFIAFSLAFAMWPE